MKYMFEDKHKLRLQDLFDWAPTNVWCALVGTGAVKDPGGKIEDEIENSFESPSFNGDWQSGWKKWYRFFRQKLQDAGYDGIVYLNRSEGLTQEEYDATNNGEVNELSDEEFKRIAPSARDSYILFKPNGTIVKQAAHDTSDETGRFWGEEGAGVVFWCPDTRNVLLAKRSQHVNEPGTWGTWGGALEEGESPEEAAKREAYEEAGAEVEEVELVWTFKDPHSDFQYHNFVAVVSHEFKPKLDYETAGFKWAPLTAPPSPTHFGLKALWPHLKQWTAEAKIARAKRASGTEAGPQTGRPPEPLLVALVNQSEWKKRQLDDGKVHVFTEPDDVEPQQNPSPFRQKQANENKIEQARQFAAGKHETQKRKYTGEPYIVHPEAVAATVRQVGGSVDMICAALLHDVIEDQGVTPQEITNQFGPHVSKLVVEMTEVSKLEDGNRKTRKQIDRDHYGSISPEGQTIKLADILDNGSDILRNNPAFARTYIPECEALFHVLTQGNAGLRDRVAQMLGNAKVKLNDRPKPQ